MFTECHDEECRCGDNSNMPKLTLDVKFTDTIWNVNWIASQYSLEPGIELNKVHIM